MTATGPGYLFKSCSATRGSCQVRQLYGESGGLVRNPFNHLRNSRCHSYCVGATYAS